MLKVMLCVTLIFGASCGGSTHPPTVDDGTESESCLRTKIWEANTDGWSIRNSGTVTLEVGDHKSFAVNLYKDREYRFLACGGGQARQVHLQLYDESGTRVKSAANAGRQPEFGYAPPEAKPHFIVVQNAANSPGTGKISWTALYK